MSETEPVDMHPADCPKCGHALVDHYPSVLGGMDACLPCMDESMVCLIHQEPL